MTVAGELNHVDPSKARDSLSAAAKGYAIKDLQLVQTPEWPLKLDKGLVDLDLRAGLASGGMDGTLGMKFQSTTFSSETRDQAGAVLKAVTSALSTVSGFSVNAHFTGTPEDYEILLSSDLDRMLGGSLGKVLEKETALFQEELRKAIFQRTEGPLGDAKGGLGGLEDVVKELTDRLNLGAGISGSSKEKEPQKGFRLPFGTR